MRELSKTYEPKEIEEKLYARWTEQDYFHAEVDETKQPFTIVIPPPNVTGQLHLGHALDETMQDILIRMKRMQGYNALWQPGTDHAAIATEVRLIETLKKEGIEKKTLGREGFLKRAWRWKEEYEGRIIGQLKKLGASCDWKRTRFTMDEGCTKAVEEVFIRLYEKGMIYQGARIVNWCPICKTTISDAEVEYEEQAGHFWHIKYPVIDDAGQETGEFIQFATTRPETMLGDTAVAVNPDDERYTKMIGKCVRLPFVNRDIPIIADGYVEKDFGTGVVKITPAHDPNDFEVGKRHGLAEINIMNDDATINANGGKFAGLDRYEARKQIVAELETLGLLVKIEDYTHSVGTHDRCGTTVEPLIKQQWFVRMEELIQPAVAAVKNREVRLIPERMEKLYFNWTDNIRDWCISRQLWWGHRIPAYTCNQCGKLVVSKTKPTACACGHTEFTQDPDTLDTWFSSALWPFSTLGWPEQTKELAYFYPTDVLVTGYDIIFFWVIRMVFSGYENMGERPFHTVLFHGLIRDAQGRKMSKSLGNGIDPLEVIDRYGADALRFTLITGNAPGNDMRYSEERIEASRNFANKVWNASRFILMNLEKATEAGVGIGGASDEMPKGLELADCWILSKANALVREATDNLERYELGIAAQKLNDFLWEEFCDWYIEMVKPRLYGEEKETKQAALWTLRQVLKTALKLLHPYMPFVTEEIYCVLREAEGTLCGANDEVSIMISRWPVYQECFAFPEAEAAIERIKEAVKAVRNLRAEMGVPMSRKAAVTVVAPKEEVRAIFTRSRVFFETLANASELLVQADKEGIAADAVSVVVTDAVLYLPLADLVDLAKEIERLQKEQTRLQAEIKRADGMLSNEKFVQKAPAEKLEAERAKREKYQGMLTQVEERLAALR